MEALGQVLPIIIYILLIGLLVVLLILGIKSIITMNKVDKMVDNVNHKIETLNGVFGFLDIVTDKISSLGDFIVNIISNKITSIFQKKKKKDEEEEEDNE